MSRRQIEIEDASIAYEEAGSGFPIIAIHGFYPDRRLMTGAFEPLFDAEGRVLLPPSAGGGRPAGGLSKRTYRRIYPDLPFMGESGDPESVRTTDDMLRVVAAFIRAVVPSGPFLIAGESYGGYLARGIAREFGPRIEGLLLLCPMIVAKNEDRALPAHQALRIEPGYSDGESPGDIEGFESVAVIRDRYTWDRAFSEVMTGVCSARSEALEALRQRGYAFSFDDIKALDTEGREPSVSAIFDPVFDRPALFVLGRQDAMAGWRDALRLAERYPRAGFAILDMAGHNLQIEQAGVFSALTAEWLGRCEDFRGAV